MGAVERGIAGKFANRFENFEAVLLSVSGERSHAHLAFARAILSSETYLALFCLPLSATRDTRRVPVFSRESLHYLYYFYGLFLHFSKINAVLNSESLPLVEINLIIKP